MQSAVPRQRSSARSCRRERCANVLTGAGEQGAEHRALRHRRGLGEALAAHRTYRWGEPLREHRTQPLLRLVRGRSHDPKYPLTNGLLTEQESSGLVAVFTFHKVSSHRRVDRRRGWQLLYTTGSPNCDAVRSAYRNVSEYGSHKLTLTCPFVGEPRLRYWARFRLDKVATRCSQPCNCVFGPGWGDSVFSARKATTGEFTHGCIRVKVTKWSRRLSLAAKPTVAQCHRSFVVQYDVS